VYRVLDLQTAVKGETMRVNVYAEEMTERIEIISKEIDGHKFTGLRLYLELPVTVGGSGQHRSEPDNVFPPINGKPAQVSGPFIHHPGDDDSAAITFWGNKDLRKVLCKMLVALDQHYGSNTVTEAEHAVRTARMMLDSPGAPEMDKKEKSKSIHPIGCPVAGVGDRVAMGMDDML
jgi:hypothetical protein